MGGFSLLRKLLFVAVCSLIALAGCSRKAQPLPQLLIYVDTDMPVAAQIAADRSLSGAAMIDTVRVDALDYEGVPFATNQFAAANAGDWPISFGVAEPQLGEKTVHLRIRVFRSALAAQGNLHGSPTLEPDSALTIDRLVEVRVASEGTHSVEVLLTGDCMGVLTSYVDPVRTCIDATHLASPPSEGIEAIDKPALSKTGTWKLARETPCAPATDRACIPGGFDIIGDTRLIGLENVDRFDSVPLRSVQLRPALLDVHEVTVERLRSLISQGIYTGDLPVAQDTDHPYCTWAGINDDTNGTLPINCIKWSTARAICQSMGGDLPSEALWEHAARGRGQSLTYPWGETPTTCCMASASRPGPPEVPTECLVGGVEPTESHPPDPLCGGFGDQTADGVYDLAGSMSEAMLDSFHSYASACWQSNGVPNDPYCDDEAASTHIARGGSWNGSLADTRVALRRLFIDESPTFGFRCAYPALEQ